MATGEVPGHRLAEVASVREVRAAALVQLSKALVQPIPQEATLRVVRSDSEPCLRLSSG